MKLLGKTIGMFFFTTYFFGLIPEILKFYHIHDGDLITFLCWIPLWVALYFFNRYCYFKNVKKMATSLLVAQYRFKFGLNALYLLLITMWLTHEAVAIWLNGPLWISKIY